MDNKDYYYTHDPLTGLPNRIAFLSSLSTFILRADAEQSKFALFKMDIDNFSTINETFGYDTGDRYLIHLAGSLSTLYPDIDYLSRMDGNEFCIIVSPVQGDEGSLLPLIHKIQAVFNTPTSIDGHMIGTHVSMGISIYPDAANNADDLILGAYRSLRYAETLEGNAIAFNSAERNARLDKQAMLATELTAALARGELSLMYQPQMHIHTKKLSGYEVLIRWHHHTFGEISPAEFIPIAEKYGLIAEIGEWVFEQAIAQHADWLNRYYDKIEHATLSINFSAKQLHDTDIIEWVTATLIKYDIPSNQVIIELTETAIMSNFDHNTHVIEQFRNLGFGIAVDDFGTGYSSLTFLGKLPITQLKIDQSFIRSVSLNPKNAAIVKALILLSDALGIEVIAEGVETEEELKYLRDNTCNIVQGYYYSKPLSPDNMTAYIQEHA